MIAGHLFILLMIIAWWVLWELLSKINRHIKTSHAWVELHEKHSGIRNPEHRFWHHTGYIRGVVLAQLPQTRPPLAVSPNMSVQAVTRMYIISIALKLQCSHKSEDYRAGSNHKCHYFVLCKHFCACDKLEQHPIHPIIIENIKKSAFYEE